MSCNFLSLGASERLGLHRGRLGDLDRRREFDRGVADLRFKPPRPVALCLSPMRSRLLRCPHSALTLKNGLWVGERMDGIRVMDATDEMFSSRRSNLAAFTITFSFTLYLYRPVSDDAAHANGLNLATDISLKDKRRLATFLEPRVRMVRILNFRSETKVILTSVFYSHGFVEDVLLSTRRGRARDTFRWGKRWGKSTL